MTGTLKTFIDLFHFLQSYSDNSILHWLKTPWKGKDKQESLLRLFAWLGLFPKLENYHLCSGNFNLQTLKK